MIVGTHSSLIADFNYLALVVLLLGTDIGTGLFINDLCQCSMGSNKLTTIDELSAIVSRV